MHELEIGMAKSGRHAYSFDDIAIVPSRRTRAPEEVSVHWQIDAYRFELPILAAPMDSVMSPQTAVAFGKHGGLGVLDLEGLWTRYDDPSDLLTEVAGLDGPRATAPLQEIYAEPLNLKEFIYELDVPVIVGGCATYQAALHLMRTGAAGVLVGFGGGAAHTTWSVLGIAVPMASAVADVAAARRDYLDESGGRYVHVIADGSIGRSGDLAKAIACGADAVMVGSPLARAKEGPGPGHHWASEAWQAELPRGERIGIGTVGTLEEILFGPSRTADGTMNLFGALRRAMAMTGYSDIKEFQRVEVVVQ